MSLQPVPTEAGTQQREHAPLTRRAELFRWASEVALVIPSLPSLLIKTGDWPRAGCPPSGLAGSISPELKTSLYPGFIQVSRDSPRAEHTACQETIRQELELWGLAVNSQGSHLF